MHDAPHNHAEHSAEKTRVALMSLVASTGLAIVKFAAAIVSGSLGLLSEAFHSLLDCGATALTLTAVRYAEQPADDRHHFGHAKAESVAALVETALLFGVTVWVAYEAINRLIYGGHEVTISWWLFAILIASIVIDFNRSRALGATAEKTSSDALAADALHFHADMLSSIAVLIGLGLSWLGYSFADPLAALVVAGFVGHAGYELGQRTLATLLDAAPEGAAEALRGTVENVRGVLTVAQLRVRPAGPIMFVDMTVDVPRTLPAAQIEAIRSEIIDRVKTSFSKADITVQINAVVLDTETAFEKVAHISAQHGLAIHHLLVQNINGRLAVSFDLELDAQTPLIAAHDKATLLENAIRDDLGADVEVEAHIEPATARLLSGDAPSPKTTRAIETLLAKLCRKHKNLKDLHNVRIRQHQASIYLHYHCRFNPDMTIEHVHDVIDAIEVAIIEARPDIKRVVAHAEPLGIEKHRL